MLGKCYWKMFCKVGDEYDASVHGRKPTVGAILHTFVNAIKTVPKPKDNRQEPILEPHYKLASIVHKLVIRKELEPSAGMELLQKQPFALKGERDPVTDLEQWEGFIMDYLRNLRAADKQHWQHRMIARVANIIYDENEPDYESASAAKLEFKDSIFTKTMHIQVWKPDAERPGRHCVYMERYVRYISRIFLLTNDKASMEALVKRVRKKASDFHKFSQVWTDCCSIYLKLIRNNGAVQAGMDEVFKSVPHDEFEIFSDRLQNWMADPSVSSPVLDALRETIELKKLNGNMMKPPPIDDLINDAWAVLYTQVAKTLPGPDPASIPLHFAQMDGANDSPATAVVRQLGPMSLNNLVMDMNGTQIPVPLTIAGSDGPRPRKVGVNRREVLRRAEAAIGRIPDAPRAVVATSSRSRNSEHPRSPVVALPSTPLNGGGNKRNGASVSVDKKEDEESERGSVHDSADDESDLSDPPDEVEMFPNLRRESTRPEIEGAMEEDDDEHDDRVDGEGPEVEDEAAGEGEDHEQGHEQELEQKQEHEPDQQLKQEQEQRAASSSPAGVKDDAMES